MKINELKPGKEYRDLKQLMQYSVTETGQLIVFDDIEQAWIPSNKDYNEVLKMRFKEIQKPISFQAAMTWMNEKRCMRTCVFDGDDFRVDEDGFLITIDNINTYIDIQMATGQWFKKEED